MQRETAIATMHAFRERFLLDGPEGRGFTAPRINMSGCGQKRGQEGRAGGHRVYEDVLPGRVSAVADGAEAVERGDAQGSGEVSVGAAANGAFTDREAHLHSE